MTENHFQDLYKYRQLIWAIAWGDFKWRYKNSVLGYFWSLLEPLVMFIILYIVFSNLMRIQVEHYQMFLLLGIIMWNFFVKASNLALFSIAGKPNLVQKVYFPREILVISGCITAVLQSIFESIIFILFMIIFWIPLTWTIIYLPIILLMYFFLVLGICLALAVMNVYYRDIQFIWTVIVQAGFFITPILYPLTIFGPDLQALFRLNPIGQIIVTSRDCILYSSAPYWLSLAYAGIASVVIFVIGYAIFRRLEPDLADVM